MVARRRRFDCRNGAGRDFQFVERLKKLGQLKAKKYLNKSSKNLEELLLRNLESA